MLDITFTNILLGYLQTAASIAAGVPTAPACAFLAMDSDADDKDPRICITAEVRGETRSRQVAVVAVCRSNRKGRDVTDAFLDAVRLRFDNRKALLDYITALPLAQRTGFQIENISRPDYAKVQREEKGPIELGVGLLFFITV